MSDEWINNNLGSADVMFAELMAMQEAENRNSSQNLLQPQVSVRLEANPQMCPNVLRLMNQLTVDNASETVHEIYNVILNTKSYDVGEQNKLSTEIFLNAVRHYGKNDTIEQIGISSTIIIDIKVGEKIKNSTLKVNPRYSKEDIYTNYFSNNLLQGCMNTDINTIPPGEVKDRLIKECGRLEKQRNIITSIVEDAIRKYPEKSSIIIPFGYTKKSKTDRAGHAVYILYNRQTGEFSYSDPNTWIDPDVINIVESLFSLLVIHDPHPRIDLQFTIFRVSQHVSCVGQHAGTCTLARYINLSHRLKLNQEWSSGTELSQIDIVSEAAKWIVWFLNDYIGCQLDENNPLRYAPNLR